MRRGASEPPPKKKADQPCATFPPQGSPIPTRAYGNNTSTRPSGVKVSVLAFTAPAPGDYQVTIRGLEDQRYFSVTEGLGVLPFLSGLFGAFATFGAFMVFVTLLILALTGIFPRRPPPIHAETEG